MQFKSFSKALKSWSNKLGIIKTQRKENVKTNKKKNNAHADPNVELFQ